MSCLITWPHTCPCPHSLTRHLHEHCLATETPMPKWREASREATGFPTSGLLLCLSLNLPVFNSHAPKSEAFGHTANRTRHPFLMEVAQWACDSSGLSKDKIAATIILAPSMAPGPIFVTENQGKCHRGSFDSGSTSRLETKVHPTWEGLDVGYGAGCLVGLGVTSAPRFL